MLRYLRVADKCRELSTVVSGNDFVREPAEWSRRGAERHEYLDHGETIAEECTSPEREKKRERERGLSCYGRLLLRRIAGYGGGNTPLPAAANRAYLFLVGLRFSAQPGRTL